MPSLPLTALCWCWLQLEAERPPGPYGVRLRIPHCHQRRDKGTDQPPPDGDGRWGESDLAVLWAEDERGPWSLLIEGSPEEGAARSPFRP